MPNLYYEYGESEHPSNFSYPPVSSSEGLPGVCPNPPWMYIKYHPNGERCSFYTPRPPHGKPGFFHWLPASRGATLCRGNCLEGSDCEKRLREFFEAAGRRVGWKGKTADDLVWRVIEAVEGGELDRYGVATGSLPGREVGYSERYRH